MNLLAIQTTKRLPNVRLKDILDEIRAGSATLGDKTLDSTLQSIWITLRQREQLVLRTMAETLKPETEVELGEYLPSEINYNKLMKALKTLRDLNLVVVKQLPNAPDVMELHPLVRQFVRNISPGQERRTIIDPILKVYKRFIGNHKSQLREAPPISLLLYWTQDAELSIRAGKLNDAFAALYEVGPCFLSSAYPREFCRVAKILFEGVNWKRDSRLRQFEGVLNTYVRLLSHLGEHGQVDVLLDEYEDTIQDRGSQYVRYCEMRSNAKWLRGEFTEAVAWGEKGTKLIEESGVDIDDEIAHTLALARRDAGEPESALSVFLRGRALLDVLDPEELDERAGGAFYGNVGRCLHLLGQIESALTCYQKSALLIEKDFEHERVLNQGYIRLWVGELLVARQQYTLAHTFFRAAYLKWKDVYPARMNAAIELSDQIRARLKDKPSGDELVERICLDWIKGRSIDG